ncbi:Hypothetical protein Achr_f490 (plasmid) [Azotobacter chroococcum NCIMB 8003]|uniref:DoxX family protein n=3 Tax=Azotobacter TaxID=352 RepID=A0A0C4WXS6_9GAMM|nr:Hypothetical protein Achr_f490 [Azotobacter chroococcum NCIMB 8003]
MVHPMSPIDRSSVWALLFMRVGAALLLLQVHGLPKLLHWQSELQRIEDPFGLGAAPTLALAVFAEVLCPLLLILGFGEQRNRNRT